MNRISGRRGLCSLLGLSAAIAMSGCDGVSTDGSNASMSESPAPARPVRLPQGAVRESSGYASILEAPSSRAAGGQGATSGSEPAADEGLFRDRLSLDAGRREVEDVASLGRILLRDGCLRLSTSPNSEKTGDGLAALPTGAATVLDREGYLSVRFAPGGSSVRIGEPIAWGGQLQQIGEDSIPARFRANCGSGPVFLLTNAQPAPPPSPAQPNVPPPPSPKDS